MSSNFTLKIFCALFLIIICHFNLKAQNNTTTAPAQKDTTKVILVVTPGQNVSTPAPAPKPATAIPAPVNTIPRNYSAPNLSERTGTATYMNRTPPKKVVTQQATSVTANSINRSSTTGTVTSTTITTTTTTKNGVVTVKKDTSIVKKDTTIVKTDTSHSKKDILKVKKDSIFANDANTRLPGGKIIFLELGGSGLALTVNYDARLHGRTGFGYQAGTGYYNTGANSVFTVPVQINYLVGKPGGDHFLEIGGGTTFLDSWGSNKGTTFIFDRVVGFIGTATIGYRYQPVRGSLNFRIGFVPIFSDEGITPAGGLSIGYTFKNN
jgi:hypothetical protein